MEPLGVRVEEQQIRRIGQGGALVPRGREVPVRLVAHQARAGHGRDRRLGAPVVGVVVDDDDVGRHVAAEVLQRPRHRVSHVPGVEVHDHDRQRGGRCLLHPCGEPCATSRMPTTMHADPRPPERRHVLVQEQDRGRDDDDVAQRRERIGERQRRARQREQPQHGRDREDAEPDPDEEGGQDLLERLAGERKLPAVRVRHVVHAHLEGDLRDGGEGHRDEDQADGHAPIAFLRGCGGRVAHRSSIRTVTGIESWSRRPSACCTSNE